MGWLGSKFADVQQLKDVLKAHQKELARGLVESFLTYALGRSIEFSDADDVDSILASVAEDDYRMRDIVKAVAKSQLFQKR